MFHEGVPDEIHVIYALSNPRRNLVYSAANAEQEVGKPGLYSKP
jgi:hypothetical protein